MIDWNNVNQDWKQITELYERLLNIPRHVIEYVAVYDYVLLSASGKSNKTISEIYDIDMDSLQVDLFEFLGYSGWKEDLDINPLFIYKSVGGMIEKFVIACRADSKILYPIEIELAYSVCERFVEMEKSINEYYR